MKSVLSLLLALAVGVVGAGHAADVEDLSGQRYLPAVHRALQEATQSVVVVMYQFSLPATPVVHPKKGAVPVSPYTLLQDLVDADERGVAVHVLLDYSYRRNKGASAPIRNPGNARAYRFLHRAGINVQRGPPGTLIHNKIAVVDESTVIHGSANWSAYAFARNSESSTLLKSTRFAAAMLKGLKTLPTDSKMTFGETFVRVRPATSTLDVPVGMLTNRLMIPAMVTASDNRAFDIYVALLAIAGGDVGYGIGKSFVVDMDWVTHQVGIGEMPKLDGRRQITKTLRKLEERYGLIQCEFKHGKSPTVTLRPQKKASERVVKVPMRFLVDGWLSRLSLKAKFLYLVSLDQAAASEIRPWYTENLTKMARLYGIHERTWYAAIRELERRDILEVARAAVPKGGEGPRLPNRYLLWPLRSQEEQANAWREMERRIPKRVLQVAMECAGKMDRPDETEVIESFARLIGQYGVERVRRATDKVAAMHPANPYRTMRYMVGVVKAEAAKARAGE